MQAFLRTTFQGKRVVLQKNIDKIGSRKSMTSPKFSLKVLKEN